MTITRYRGSREVRRVAWRGFARLSLLAVMTGLVLPFPYLTVHTELFSNEFSFAVVVPFAFWAFGGYFGWTTTDSKGIRTWGGNILRVVPWRDVVAVEVHGMTGRGTRTYMVQVQRRNGSPVRLWGLIALEALDPKLLSDMKAIRADWKAATASR